MRFVGCTEAAQNLHKLHRTPVLCTTPPSPIPPFSPKVASKRATILLPSHGLTAEYFSSLKPKETAHPIPPTTSKWQIPLRQWQKPARREPERSAASAKRAETLHQRVPRGVAPGAPLVTFPATGKSPGCRAERLHWRSWGHPPRTNSPRRGAKKKQKPQKGGCKKGEFVR